MAARDVLERLGRRIHDLRLGAALTQEMLAERTGITWHYVSAIERGTKSATIETLCAIAAALDVSLSELFLDVDRPVPRELPRIGTALAGRSTEVQRVVLRIVSDALALGGLDQHPVEGNLRAAERRPRRNRRSDR